MQGADSPCMIRLILLLYFDSWILGYLHEPDLSPASEPPPPNSNQPLNIRDPFLRSLILPTHQKHPLPCSATLVFVCASLLLLFIFIICDSIFGVGYSFLLFPSLLQVFAGYRYMDCLYFVLVISSIMTDLICTYPPIRSGGVLCIQPAGFGVFNQHVDRTEFFTLPPPYCIKLSEIPSWMTRLIPSPVGDEEETDETRGRPASPRDRLVQTAISDRLKISSP